jgi:hypothetical protein
MSMGGVSELPAPGSATATILIPPGGGKATGDGSSVQRPGRVTERAGGMPPGPSRCSLRRRYFLVLSAGAVPAGAMRRFSTSFISTSLLSTLNSTRRFCARPSGVLLVAIGLDGP